MLYFIAARGRIKIGHSRDPFIRAQTFQTGNAEKCRVLLSLEIENAREVEALMHERLAFCRVEGEWFEVSFQRAFHELAELLPQMVFLGQIELGLSSSLKPRLEDCAEEFKRWWVEKINPRWDERQMPLIALWKCYRDDFLARADDDQSVEQKDKALCEAFAKIKAELR
jgi:hypothetical protein